MDELEAIKRRLIIKTLTRPGLNALKQANRKGSVVAMPFLVNHLVEFGFLTHKQDVSSWSDNEDEGPSDNVIEALYCITDAGKGLLNKWKL